MEGRASDAVLQLERELEATEQELRSARSEILQLKKLIVEAGLTIRLSPINQQTEKKV